jgi:hypothetical protein
MLHAKACCSAARLACQHCHHQHRPKTSQQQPITVKRCLFNTSTFLTTSTYRQCCIYCIMQSLHTIRSITCSLHSHDADFYTDSFNLKSAGYGPVQQFCSKVVLDLCHSVTQASCWHQCWHCLYATGCRTSGLYSMTAWQARCAGMMLLHTHRKLSCTILSHSQLSRAPIVHLLPGCLSRHITAAVNVNQHQITHT